MIEQRFKRGVRFLWNKPPDAGGALDGAIVASVGAATHLTYDGLDGHPAVLDPHLLGGNPGATLGGIVKGTNVPYAWLDYAPGRTARLTIGGYDILTGYMSGCLIVRGTFGGFMNAFHVGTIQNDATTNQTVKQLFAQNLPPDATGFNPLAAWPDDEINVLKTKLGGGFLAKPNIIAMVTIAGTFYSILMFNVAEKKEYLIGDKVGIGTSFKDDAQREYFCVGGIKIVQPMNRIRLMASLMQ